MIEKSGMTVYWLINSSLFMYSVCLISHANYFRMSSNEPDGNGADGALPPPPPPPPIPPNVIPIQAELEQAPELVKKKVVRVPIARRGLASKGQKITLLTNHFKVNVSNIEGHFFHYSVRSFLYTFPLIFKPFFFSLYPQSVTV